MDELLSEDERNNFQMLNQFIWESKVYENNIEDWLSNFKGKYDESNTEKKIALELLSNFIYFNKKEIDYLLKLSFEMFKTEKIKDYFKKGLSFSEAENNFKFFLENNCKVLQIGRQSESGTFLLYPFRTENDLPLSLFDLENVSKNISCMIYIDDFLGTGQTIIDTWKEIESCHNKNKEYYLITLIALKKGIENIYNETDFKIICPVTFSNEYRIFDPNSYVYGNNHQERNHSKLICSNYGKFLVDEKDSLGYKDSQALIGLSHNIPDNTIPIIWANNKEWIPIFKRKMKKYGEI